MYIGYRLRLPVDIHGQCIAYTYPAQTMAFTIIISGSAIFSAGLRPFYTRHSSLSEIPLQIKMYRRKGTSGQLAIRLRIPMYDHRYHYLWYDTLRNISHATCCMQQNRIVYTGLSGQNWTGVDENGVGEPGQTRSKLCRPCHRRLWILITRSVAGDNRRPCSINSCRYLLEAINTSLHRKKCLTA